MHSDAREDRGITNNASGLPQEANDAGSQSNGRYEKEFQILHEDSGAKSMNMDTMGKHEDMPGENEAGGSHHFVRLPNKQ
ncbi:hypothetical protein V2G26_009827 [Clonostachys chloroleuca]